jgi:MSHA pilin protein MshC
MSSRISANLRNSAPDRSRTRGFTLVEILMVVVILGIMSAIIIPQIGSRDDVKAAAAARYVMSDLIYAQNHAIATQTKHYVRFSGSTYTIYNSPTLATPIKNPVTKNTYQTTISSAGNQGFDGVTIQSSSFGTQTTIGFDELGSPFAFNPSTQAETSLTTAGTVVIASGSNKLTVSIEPFTGEVSVQ